MRKILVFALLTVLSNTASADVVYYVDLINTAPNSITYFGVALPGTDRFHSALPGNTPIHGGGESATVAIRRGNNGCLRDLRIGFADGRVLTHRGFNICRNVSYHSGRYLRLGILAATAAAKP